MSKEPITKEKAQNIFNTFDKNGDGFITDDEFISYCYHRFEINQVSTAVNEMIADIFSLADGQGLLNRKDGKLNFDEFYRMAKIIPEEHETVAQTMASVLYQMADTDGDKSVSTKEMIAFLKRIGPDWKKDEIKKVVRRLDRNTNEKIEFDEFIRFYIGDEDD